MNSLTTGERMYPRAFSEVNLDHQYRYQFALQFISEGDRILDAACGVGYGSYFMALNSRCSEVIGIDVSSHALEWADRYFCSTKNRFIQIDLNEPLPDNVSASKYDLITSYETIEHLRDDRKFLERITILLKDNGRLILSAPNEDLIPHENNPLSKSGRNPFHYRHYTSEDLRSLVLDSGLFIERCFTQCFDVVFPGKGGFVNILVCRGIPVEEKPHTDLDEIIKACTLLNVTQNNIRKNLELTALASRFSEIIVAYENLAAACKDIEAERFEKSIRTLNAINESICPEKTYYEGLAAWGMKNYDMAKQKLLQVLTYADRINPILLHHSKIQLSRVCSHLFEESPEKYR